MPNACGAPLKRGRGGNVFVTINSGDALLLSPPIHVYSARKSGYHSS
jgi:hypothetical protein